MNKYERAFFNVIIVLLAISVTTMTSILINTGEMPIILPLLAIPIVYFAYMQLQSQKPLYLSRFLGNLIAFFTLAATLIYGLNVSTPLSSILYFLFILLFVKLLQKKKSRDYLQIILFSLAFMLITSVYQPAIWFLAIFAAYIIVGLWALILLHFKNEVEGAYTPDKQPIMNVDSTLMRRIFQGKFFAFITTLSILTIVVTTLGFLAMPRLRAGWLSPLMPPLQNTSGLSDSVQLAGGGKIQLDNRRALYVTWDEKPDSEILYRGIAQPNYTAKVHSWTADNTERSHYVTGYFAPSLGRIMSLKNAAKLGANKVTIIDQQISRTFMRFVTPGIVRDFQLIEPKKKRFAIEYPAATIKSETLLFERNVAYKTECLKSPKKLQEFWDAKPEKWTGGFQDDPQYEQKYIDFVENNCPPLEGKTGWDAKRIQRLTDVLSSSPFSYTLDQPDIPYNQSPIDYFLFEGHAGHCEYFASALAMLLQAEGVNAQVVTGFASNPVNLQEIEGKWVDDVRYKQAHAWVEVKFKDWGWVPFNPTPGGYIPQYEEMSGLQRFFSMIQYKYQRYVLDFNIQDQKSLAKDVKGSISGIGEKIENIGSDILSTILGENEFPTWLKLLIGFVVFIVPIAVITWLFRFIKRRYKFKLKKSNKITDSLDSEFKMLLRLFEKIRRNRRSASETFNEIVISSEVYKIVGVESVEWLREIYWEIRFNEATLNDEIRTKLRDFAHKIKEKRSSLKVQTKS